MTKNDSNVVAATQKSAEIAANPATSERDAAKAAAAAAKAEQAEREARVAAGDRVFTEVASDVKPFEPVYADHLVAESVDIRAAQGERGTPAKE